MKINILVDKESSRVNYACNFIFREVLKLDFQIFTQIPSSDILHVNYSSLNTLSESVSIPVSGFLTDFNTSAVDCKTSGEKREFRMFINESGDDFDLFAMVFYFISRYEEYFIDDRDEFDRITFDNFTAVKNQFSEIPLVDILILDFYEKLRAQFLDLKAFTPEFTKLAGIDIDFMYAYQHKSLLRLLGAIIKSVLKLDFKYIRSLFSARTSQNPDPYADFDAWLSPLENSTTKLNVFVLAAQRREGKDENLSPRHPAFFKWIRTLTDTHKVPCHWHPSIQSHADPKIMMKEKKLLEHFTHRPITKSRQHFLHFTLPHTFRNLIQMGIREEHSMGFYDRTGYRASTAYSHLWYDLQAEKTTSLRIFPFVVMDVTLLRYMKLNTEESIRTVRHMINQQQITGGIFSFIWHNSSFLDRAGWKGWDQVYHELVK